MSSGGKIMSSGVVQPENLCKKRRVARIMLYDNVNKGERNMDKKKKLFAEAKIKLVMKVFGLSRRRAIERIAHRDEAELLPEHGAVKPHMAGGMQRNRVEEEELISAKDFFGEL